VDQLVEWDVQAFLWLNDLHTNWLDPVMYFLTHTIAWTPLFLVLLYFIVKVHGKYSWIFLVGLALTIVCADQVTSSLIKPYFERLRPSHNPAISEFVHIVNGYKGGRYGFASSHAANTFGAATFIVLLIKQRYPAAGWLFLWAGLVSYTRIYLGVHYPGDLIVGGAVGAFFAWVFCRLATMSKDRIAQ
jgi:undecaprenyl-diphosphatase